MASELFSAVSCRRARAGRLYTHAEGAEGGTRCRLAHMSFEPLMSGRGDPRRRPDRLGLSPIVSPCDLGGAVLC